MHRIPFCFFYFFCHSSSSLFNKDSLDQRAQFVKYKIEQTDDRRKYCAKYDDESGFLSKFFLSGPDDPFPLAFQLFPFK